MNIDKFVEDFLSSLQFNPYFFFSFYFLFYILFLFYPIYLYISGNKKELRKIFIAIIIGFLIIALFKFIFKRERPENSLLKKIDYSFPSSHAYFSFLFLISSIKTTVFIIVFFLSFLSIISLLFLLVHHLTDILFSIFLAIVIYKLVDKFFERITKEKK